MTGPRPTRAEYESLLRLDFASFAERAFYELNPRTPFAPGWHIELIAAKLAAVRAGTIRRLIVNLPPRHLKSLLASVALPAWCLGHEPALAIMCVSYGQDLADPLARDCRRIVTSHWYRRLFPTRLSAERSAVAEFVTTRNGVRLAVSVGGALTGRGGDIIILDDPLKPEEALSAVQRRAVNEWYDHTLYSRLDDKGKSAIVLVMHRLHEDDLTAHVLRQEEWEVVSLPAIAEAAEAFTIETPLGRRHFARREGEALHPAREPRPLLDQIRRRIGDYNFAGQYQQRPAPQGGGLVKRAWFKSYTPDSLPQPFERILQSWDTANTASELSDFSVCTSWGIKGRELYLLHVLRARMEYPELKRRVRAEWARRDADVVLIEDKGSGTQLIQELIEDGVYAVTRYRPKGDKIMRLHAQTATIENGFVHLPQAAPWLDDYLDELTAFPNARHDDQVDATAQALDWLKGAGREPGILAYYRELAERRAASAAGAARHGEGTEARTPVRPGSG
jgi:predicted phage terminase large subunit-like protein